LPRPYSYPTVNAVPRLKFTSSPTLVHPFLRVTPPSRRYITDPPNLILMSYQTLALPSSSRSTHPRHPRTRTQARICIRTQFPTQRTAHTAFHVDIPTRLLHMIQRPGRPSRRDMGRLRRRRHVGRRHVTSRTSTRASAGGMLSAAKKPGLAGRALRRPCAISRRLARLCWVPVAGVVVIIWRACSRIPAVGIPILVVVVVLVLIIFASSLHGALVIGIETDFLPCLLALAAALFAVGAGAGGGGFFEEEG